MLRADVQRLSSNACRQCRRWTERLIRPHSFEPSILNREGLENSACCESPLAHGSVFERPIMPFRGLCDYLPMASRIPVPARHLPMLRHVAEPLDAGGLEADVGVEAAGDGLADDGLLLLLQQRDELPLGADVAPDAPVDVVQVADDGGLLGEGWEGKMAVGILRSGLEVRVTECRHGLRELLGLTTSCFEQGLQ